MNSGDSGKKRVLNEKEALELVAEYMERWPNKMGTKYADRWVRHLVGQQHGPFQKAWDELMMKCEFGFSFERLKQRAGDLTPEFNESPQQKMKREYETRGKEGSDGKTEN